MKEPGTTFMPLYVHCHGSGSSAEEEIKSINACVDVAAIKIPVPVHRAEIIAYRTTQRALGHLARLDTKLEARTCVFQFAVAATLRKSRV